MGTSYGCWIRSSGPIMRAVCVERWMKATKERHRVGMEWNGTTESVVTQDACCVNPSLTIAVDHQTPRRQSKKHLRQFCHEFFTHVLYSPYRASVCLTFSKINSCLEQNYPTTECYPYYYRHWWSIRCFHRHYAWSPKTNQVRPTLTTNP